MPEDVTRKLDRVLEIVSDLRVDVGRVAERVDGMGTQQSARDREFEALADREREDITRLQSEIDALKERPEGITGRQLWATVCSAGAFVGAVVGVVVNIIK